MPKAGTLNMANVRGISIAKVAWTLLVLSFVMSVSLGLFLRNSATKAFSDSTFDAFMARAIKAAESNDFTSAHAQYELLISRYPEREEGLLAYAGFSEKAGEPDRARKLYERALVSTPEANKSLLAYTGFLDRQSESNVALDVCRKYVASNPKDAWAQYELGMRLLSKGDAKLAISHFLAASKLQQIQTSAMQRVGQAYFTMGKMDDAIDAWRQVLASDSSLEAKQILYDIGRAYFERKDVRSAIDAWEECIRYFPNSLWCASQLVTAYTAAGQRNDADRVRALVAAMTPSLPIAKDLAPFLQIEGVSVPSTKCMPGDNVAIQAFIVYFTSRTEDVQPEIEFLIHNDKMTALPGQKLRSAPERLSHGPWMRGDCNVQTFVLSIPSDLSPGTYKLEVALNLSSGQPIPVCDMEILNRELSIPSS